MKEKLIPIAPEEFKTMKPGTEIFSKAKKSHIFLELEDPPGTWPIRTISIKGKKWRQENYSVYDWYRRPEPEPKGKHRLEFDHDQGWIVEHWDKENEEWENAPLEKTQAYFFTLPEPEPVIEFDSRFHENETMKGGKFHGQGFDMSIYSDFKGIEPYKNYLIQVWEVENE